MGNRKWRKEETFKAVQLKAMGYTRIEIAARMRRSYSAICHVLQAVKRGDLSAY